MNAISWEDYIKEKIRLEIIIVALIFWVFLLIMLSCALGLYTYKSICFERDIHEKIIAFKAKNNERINILATGKHSFVRENTWKGLLRRDDQEEVANYDREIERLEYQNQAINLLEIKLSTP